MILGVLSQALPDRYPAANCGQASVICGTVDDQTNQRIVGAIGGPWMGGMGARPNKDGIDTTDHDGSNVYHVPLEVSEAELPIRFNKMELWNDSEVQEMAGRPWVLFRGRVVKRKSFRFFRRVTSFALGV